MKTKTTPVEILHLWESIFRFSLASEECSAEGNSGEFHDKDEANRLYEIREAAFVKLRNAFIAATGWIPAIQYKDYTGINIVNTKKWNDYNQALHKRRTTYMLLCREEHGGNGGYDTDLDQKFPLVKPEWVFLSAETEIGRPYMGVEGSEVFWPIPGGFTY